MNVELTIKTPYALNAFRNPHRSNIQRQKNGSASPNSALPQPITPYASPRRLTNHSLSMHVMARKKS